MLDDEPAVVAGIFKCSYNACKIDHARSQCGEGFGRELVHSPGLIGRFKVARVHILAVRPGDPVGPFLDEGEGVVESEHQVAGVHAELPCGPVEKPHILFEQRPADLVAYTIVVVVERRTPLGGSRFALLTATQPAGPGLQRLEYTSYDTQSQDKAASFVVTVPDEPWTGGLWMIPGGSGFVAALGDQDTGYRFYLVDIRTGASHQLSDVVVGSVKDGGFTADGSALYFTGGEPASRPDRLWVLPLGAR